MAILFGLKVSVFCSSGFLFFLFSLFFLVFYILFFLFIFSILLMF